MFLFTQILCVKYNVLYIGSPNVQIRGGAQPPSTGPACRLWLLVLDEIKGHKPNTWIHSIQGACAEKHSSDSSALPLWKRIARKFSKLMCFCNVWPGILYESGSWARKKKSSNLTGSSCVNWLSLIISLNTVSYITVPHLGRTSRMLVCRVQVQLQQLECSPAFQPCLNVTVAYGG